MQCATLGYDYDPIAFEFGLTAAGRVPLEPPRRRGPKGLPCHVGSFSDLFQDMRVFHNRVLFKRAVLGKHRMFRLMLSSARSPVQA